MKSPKLTENQIVTAMLYVLPDESSLFKNYENRYSFFRNEDDIVLIQNEIEQRNNESFGDFVYRIIKTLIQEEEEHIEFLIANGETNSWELLSENEIGVNASIYLPEVFNESKGDTQTPHQVSC